MSERFVEDSQKNEYNRRYDNNSNNNRYQDDPPSVASRFVDRKVGTKRVPTIQQDLLRLDLLASRRCFGVDGNRGKVRAIATSDEDLKGPSIAVQSINLLRGQFHRNGRQIGNRSSDIDGRANTLDDNGSGGEISSDKDGSSARRDGEGRSVGRASSPKTVDALKIKTWAGLGRASSWRRRRRRRCNWRC